MNSDNIFEKLYTFYVYLELTEHDLANNNNNDKRNNVDNIRNILFLYRVENG